MINLVQLDNVGVSQVRQVIDLGPQFFHLLSPLEYFFDRVLFLSLFASGFQHNGIIGTFTDITLFTLVFFTEAV